MLTKAEIKQFIDEDSASMQKKYARTGQAYYDGDHDIKGYRLFYFNADGNLVEDETRSNVKIPHPFFTELVDQAVQYILSGDDAIIKSDIPELQTELDKYFLDDENFIAELSEVLTGCQTKGFEYMFAYINDAGLLSFECADALGVVEVEAKFASDNEEHILYWYIDRINKEGKTVKRIMDWTAEQVAYYTQEGNEEIEDDASQPINPRKHVMYKEKGNKKNPKIYTKSFDVIPFFRIDNNKKKLSALKPIKDLIDDYDLMASSLSNNLVDFDTPIHVVKGYEGDNLNELQQNLKTKKIVGVDSEGDIDIKTVDVPYQARIEKLNLDEKNIYRFGMGLNTSGLKDTNATTNIAIKAAYSLLELKCYKLIIQLKKLLRKILKLVLNEINTLNKTDYQMKDVYFDFEPEVMSNAKENADKELVEAQKQQVAISTLLNIQALLDSETLMQSICTVMDIDYEEIKSKLPDPDEAANEVNTAQAVLSDIPAEPGEGEVLNE